MRIPRKLPKPAILLLLTMPLALALNARLEPTKEMAAQTRWVVNVINARHYLSETMQHLDGKEMVEAYTASIDYGKMYFLRSEVDDFVFRFAEPMEKFLEKGNLYAAFEIYDTYKEHAQARTEWAYERLKGDFDFSLDENFAPDRREADWPASKEEAQSLWERRLKYELLNEMLSLAAESKDNEAVSLEPENPDVVDVEADEFDPAKLERLLNDPEFEASILDEAREKIHRRYERNLRLTLDREAADIQESFVNAMTQLFDPHSSFLSADTLESFNTSVQNSFVGIGALLQDDDGICTIKDILPGGPAEESGDLEPEDQILGVAQGKDGEFEDVVDMQLRYIVRKIKGEKNTIVRLLIRPGAAADPSVRKVVTLVRDEVKLTANLASAELIDVPVGNEKTIPVGVIVLPSFYGNIGAGGTLTTTTDDVAELLNKLRDAGAEGIILDLRMNGGGLLSEAVRLAGLFIPVGPVVQVRDSDGRKDVLNDRDPSLLWDGPLIVLTSRFSASASEIVAGALQDHGRALIVGNTSTHGKGTVQEVYHMNTRMPFSLFQNTTEQARPVATKITIKQFFLPEGSSTQLKGVPSDIILPSVNEFLPIGESDLDHALPWDKIDAVDWLNDWAKIGVASPDAPGLLDSLQASSQARQDSLDEFQFLKQQIDWRHQRFEEKEISLNLKQRIEKKVREQSYVEELDNHYDTLKENSYLAQEILLKVAEEQEEISKKNQAEPEKDATAQTEADPADDSQVAESDADEEEDEPPFDIYLRESARIMADWVQFLDKDTSQTAQATVNVEAN
ncbi:carboxy terminal-processing peptidase [Coraliomargarita parva]|uniref:carboxy terminal-processing peptidase n=1 Tax=Coraliomargarita parva TaxID=3014050 RepID=UPI0022B3BD40|nr:carboxy terminal-processing peptidase [Coraliomargarita parva]